MNITAIILSYNEEIHIERCIKSISNLVNEIILVDSFSNDNTIHIAKENGAVVFQRKWINHSEQFNWALSKVSTNSDWIFKIDADEVLTPELELQLTSTLDGIDESINGINVSRSIKFLNKLIRFGAVHKLPVLRVFRNGFGKSESRWMDEHIIISGNTITLDGEIIDHNLNSISWWTEKHNRYASCEALEVLNSKYSFFNRDDNPMKINENYTVFIKRFIKDKFYPKIPHQLRSFLYFIYRYFIRLGFLDGKEGLIFHFLQAFWYRFLVDSKVYEVENYVYQHKVDPRDAVKVLLDINI